ncbi:uncharacterized protein RSE6_14851 [Rhynchosporium secalis]|uniref:Uncharacterized protein n=1 Tax=Rhynchosporium secalis TaxID=38038 RepID=A0A1E1MWA3_RHYSE|nr:uncharacterized protein RSE6_14851 [Rhynchosporium secalis]
MKYTEVQVPVDHPIFTISPTQISDHMGFPLHVRKVGDFRRRDIEKGDNMGINAFKNRSALFLNMEAEIQGHNWGWADIFVWDQDIGTVLVVRQDKRLLTSPQVEALAKYCKLELLEHMEILGEGFYDESGGPKSKAEVLKAKKDSIRLHIGREAFEKYFHEVKEKKVLAGDGSWEHAKAPYSDEWSFI